MSRRLTLAEAIQRELSAEVARHTFVSTASRCVNMPADISPKPPRVQISLRSLLIISTLFAVAMGAGFGRIDFLYYGLIAAAIAGGVPLLVGWLPYRINGAFMALAATAAVTVGLNVFMLESTFGSFEVDGVPVAGWPRVLASGKGLMIIPAPPPPSFHVYGDPYWTDQKNLRYDLIVGLVVCFAATIVAIRPRWTSLEGHVANLVADEQSARTSKAIAIFAWLMRLSLVAAAGGWLFSKDCYYDPSMISRHDIRGTWLHFLTLVCLATLLPLPICFPVHRSIWESGKESWGQRIGRAAWRSLWMASLAALVCVSMLRVALWIGEWQHHYLNLERTWILISISLVWGGSLAMPLRTDATNHLAR